MSASTTSSSLSSVDGARFLADLLGRDPTAAMSRLHDDIEWIVPGSPEFGGGVHQGRKAVLRFFALVGKLFPAGLRIAELREWKSPTASAVEATLEGTTANGATYRNKYVFVIDFNDRDVRRVSEYTDTVHAEAVLRAESNAGGVTG